MHWSCLNREVEPYERLTALIFGFLPAQLVYLMARLRLSKYESSATDDVKSWRGLTRWVR
jgi:hypothetical protein